MVLIASVPDLCILLTFTPLWQKIRSLECHEPLYRTILGFKMIYQNQGVHRRVF